MACPASRVSRGSSSSSSWWLGRLAWPGHAALQLANACAACVLLHEQGIDGRFWGLPRQKVSGIWPSQITGAGGTVLLLRSYYPVIPSNHHRRQSAKQVSGLGPLAPCPSGQWRSLLPLSPSLGALCFLCHVSLVHPIWLEMTIQLDPMGLVWFIHYLLSLVTKKIKANRFLSSDHRVF